MKKYRKRSALLIIVSLLIVFRLFLPSIVKNYLNNVLSELPGYTGAVEDVDIALIRGAYIIRGMHLSVVDAGTEVPFIQLPEADISVEWKSLFKGRIVSEIILNTPEIIYVMEDQADAKGADQKDWTKALTDIVPLNINRFEVHEGKISLVMLSADPDVDLTMEKVELTANNLSNVIAAEQTLPSAFNMSASTFGNGTLAMDGNLNLLKEIPDMDITFKLENSDVTALNDLTKHYGKADFESGIFNLYGELAIANSYLKGYVKPFIKNSKLIGPEDHFVESVWEGFIGFFKFVFKNQKTDSVAMKVPFEGDLKNVDTAVWSTVVSIINNAWIEAFVDNVDNTIEFQDAFQDRKEMTKKKSKGRKKS